MKNTFIIAFVSLLGQVVVCSMVAYSIAKIRWTLARPITVILFATMMLPYFTILIPLYKTWSSLGLTGTPWPLVLCNLFGNSFYIIIVRQFILGIPNSILEAAFVDGTSELQRYICIVLPLSKSALATVAILSFVANWSDYLNPMLYLVNKNDFTLSLGLYAFIGQHSVEWPLLMAAASIFVIPAIIIFILFQKQFIRGIAITGLK
jgi:multiple sugar transport system permease protein